MQAVVTMSHFKKLGNAWRVQETFRSSSEDDDSDVPILKHFNLQLDVALHDHQTTSSVAFLASTRRMDMNQSGMQTTLASINLRG